MLKISWNLVDLGRNSGTFCIGNRYFYMYRQITISCEVKTYFHHRIVNFQDIHLKFLYVVDNLIKIWYELFPELFWTSLFREGEIFEQKSMKIAFLMVFLCGKHNIVQNALISECIELWKSLTTLTSTIEVIKPNFTNFYKEISVHNPKMLAL